MNFGWNTGKYACEEKRWDNTRCDLGNKEYMMAFDQVIIPVLKEFEPEVIIVSCGFDCAMHDFLGWS